VAAAADPRVRVHRSPTNTGGAGGFAEGIDRAYATGADAVWLMDDDCYAAPDALERLVAGYHRAAAVLAAPIAFAGSIVTWTDGSVCVMNSPPASDDWGDLIARGERITLVEKCSFVSMLVPRWAIARYGLPLRDYFIWFDDAEYSHRLRAGGRGIQVHDSVVVHDLAENLGVNVAHLDAASAWKFRYGLRNESSFQWHHADLYRWLEFVLLTVVRLRRGGVPWRLRLQMARSILAGLRFDPRPESVTEA
jgi:GT2 family glycosyltransferase